MEDVLNGLLVFEGEVKIRFCQVGVRVVHIGLLPNTTENYLKNSVLFESFMIALGVIGVVVVYF